MSHKNAGHRCVQLSLPSGIWEKDGQRFEVALSQYDVSGNPQVKFAPLPSEWVSWETLHEHYQYIGKVSKLEKGVKNRQIL